MHKLYSSYLCTDTSSQSSTYSGEYVLDWEGWLGVLTRPDSFKSLPLIHSEHNTLPQSLTGSLWTLAALAREARHRTAAVQGRERVGLGQAWHTLLVLQR